MARSSGGQAARQRGDVHDCAALPLAHLRQHRTDHPHCTEVICFEHLLSGFDGHQLEGPAAADSGVVHQHIDSASLAPDFVYSICDRGVVVYV